MIVGLIGVGYQGRTARVIEHEGQSLIIASTDANTEEREMTQVIDEVLMIEPSPFTAQIDFSTGKEKRRARRAKERKNNKKKKLW